ncbi:MAG: hypothetical protein NC337_02720 [Roseburia sp.]|nr:hypothetical protein [Roseburia sp.]
MKKGYMIGLFFVCSVIVALVVTLMWKRHTMDGFPRENENREQAAESETEESSTVQRVEIERSVLTDVDNADASQVQSVPVVTTKDTVCIYQDIDQKDGTVSIVEEKLSARYIGLNREELEEALEEDSRVRALEEESGFKSQHLELFSPERIKVLRIYDTSTLNKGYYIMEVDGEIRIYRDDKETLYYRTDLILQNLPESLQQEIIEGKYIDSEVKVYHFLESYSS